MIYYKISFLIVLISVVCFSAAVKSEEQRRIDDCIKICKKILVHTFGQNSTARTSVQHAITNLKLYGKYADELDVNVNRYYENFHSSVKLETVLLPSEFCKTKGKHKEYCESQLSVFLEKVSKDESDVPISGSNDDGSLEANTSKRNLYGPSKSGYHDDEDTLPMTILKNALYFHVTERTMPPEEELRKYYHEYNSLGYLYLHRMGKYIEVDTAKLPNRVPFCTELYTKSKRQKTVHDDDAGTSYNAD